ncbi:MAG: DUF1492 domain-containing protein [Acidaminococcaceae bacterium]|nr:DUF1492 domain-containing protein [Acidaminococcaceae bacterium]
MNKTQLRKKLSKYIDCRGRIKNNSEEIERLRGCMHRVTVAYRDAPGWDRKTSDQAVILTEIDKLTQKIRADSGRLETERQRVEALINRLNNKDDRDVLRMIYITGYKPKEVGIELALSRSQVYRIRARAEFKLLKKDATKCDK